MNSENLKHCAILSMDQLDDFESYDDLLDEPLANIGWKTRTVSWRDNSIDWNQFDVVVIRSTWDYQDDPDLFIQQLKRIDQSSARLENPLELVLWNINKTYLKELEQKGSCIVPTLWGKSLNILSPVPVISLSTSIYFFIIGIASVKLLMFFAIVPVERFAFSPFLSK